MKWIGARVGPDCLTISARVNQRDNNFTMIRLLAAYAVLYVHSYGLSLGRPAQDPLTQWVLSWWGHGLGHLAVMVFFVISGFLVTGSYLHRNDALAFAEARLLRVLPGLWVAVFFSVFVVGLYASTLPWDEFLSDPGTWAFIKKNVWLLDGASYKLPGVFDNNPRTVAVNGSLWTLPIEFYMYIFVFMLGIFGILKRRVLFNAVFMLLLVLFVCIDEQGIKLSNPFLKHYDLIMAYLAGMFLYINRGYVPLSFSMLAILMLLMFLSRSFSMFWLPASVLGMAYVVIFAAIHPALRLPSVDRWGDFSYGLYIYAFPVQQLLVLEVSRSPLVVLLLSTLIVLPLAILSWRYVEKPVLRLKGHILRGRRWDDPRVGSA